MKKILFVVAFAVISVFGASAQSNDVVFAEVGQYIRLGYAGVANSSTSNLNGGFDLGVNIIEFGVRPYSTGAISLGADFMLDTFHPAKDHYFFTSGDLTVIVPSIFSKIKYSTATVLALGVPLNFTQNIGGKLNITVGATAKVNMNASTRLVYSNSDNKKWNTERTSGIPTNRLTYDVHCAVDVNGFGIYASYSPMNIFESGHGPQFNMFSVGLIWKN